MKTDFILATAESVPSKPAVYHHSTAILLLLWKTTIDRHTYRGNIFFETIIAKQLSLGRCFLTLLISKIYLLGYFKIYTKFSRKSKFLHFYD